MGEERERERKRETNIVKEGERIRSRFVIKNTGIQQVTLNVCYRVAKTHRIPFLYSSFSAKVTYI